MRVLDDDDLVELLRSRVKNAGGQSAFARQHGVQRSYLNEIVGGKKPPGAPSILSALNLRIVYAPVDGRTPSDTRVLDNEDVLELLRSSVSRAGSQTAFSKQGVERAHLNQLLNGRRPLSPSIIDALNLRAIYLPVG